LGKWFNKSYSFLASFLGNYANIANSRFYNPSIERKVMGSLLTFYGSRVSKNFGTLREAEAFHDGVKVLEGMLTKNTTITYGNILPLDGKGYTTSVIINRDIPENVG
jgi:hypothetical protein